jgi:ketosteroid isomerase-like protein
MKNRKSMLATVSVLGILILVSSFSSGFEGIPLKDYKTANNDEKEIISTLIAYEDAYNAHDAESLLSYCCDDARLMVGGRTERYSKENVRSMLPTDFEYFQFSTFYNPDITVSRDKASVDLIVDTGLHMQLDTGTYHTADYDFVMRKEGDKWMILETTIKSWDQIKLEP